MKPSAISDNSTKSEFPVRHPGMGIALRITLLSWLLSLITLTIFVIMIIPQQKKTFLNNLESKANSVAVSLHDVAAGAAVNEDYASLVSAGQTLVNGDPDLDFLVIVKNDGFALAIRQSGWKSLEKAPGAWLPCKREAIKRIAIFPFLNLRVFHFAQPFDYSGIQWGWIHVGLSLAGYDKSVTDLYRNTVILALGCILFSLLASLIYAGYMVRPILRLRHVVHQIASGDLSVRADVFRRDELGNLAESVNIMTESLLRRDRIMESVRFASEQFLRAEQWEDIITLVLSKIGQAGDTSRAYIFENHQDDAGRLCLSQRFEWVAEGVSPQLLNQDLQNLPYTDSGLQRWSALLGRNEIITGPVSEMSAAERKLLEPQGIYSLIAIPIFVEGVWWGFLGLDDCVQVRVWREAEKISLRALADMLGAAIARQKFQDELKEAKITLEHRVFARTRELRDQITAKEDALEKLAAAQSSLIEMSRAAGMAEVATGVLHNVGNVLNSINVSCTLIMEQLRESRIVNVARVAELITGSGEDPVRYLTEDPRGRNIPAYLSSLATKLEEEHQLMLREGKSLLSRIEHIKEIVTMQQAYGHVSGVLETLRPDLLMEDALKINEGSLARHEIKVQREYQPTPAVTVDKHKILQVLLNLINNAKHACTESSNKAKIVTLRIFCPDSNHLIMQVADNGIGILPDNLTKIFQHGFTTRPFGHGFGLHSGALAAKSIGGNLTAYSEGIGLGATFTLELHINTGGRK